MAERKPYVTDGSSKGEVQAAQQPHEQEPMTKVSVNTNGLVSLCWEGPIDRVESLYRMFSNTIKRLELSEGSVCPNVDGEWTFPPLHDVERWVDHLKDDDTHSEDIELLQSLLPVCRLRLSPATLKRIDA